MASISRFDTRPNNYDYSWKTYVPELPQINFEAWDEMLSNQQQKYDRYNTILDEKKPRYLQTEEDRKLFQEYNSLADGSKTAISDAFVKEGLSAGNRMMKDYGQKISNEWKPGGRASVLEDRVNSFAEAQKQIEETFKNDTNPANKWYAYKQLKDQLKNPLNYNPETGEYSKITTPELYKDANILKSVNEAIDRIKESGDTQIVRLSPFWLQKIKTEGKTAETLGAVTQALLQQPEFAKQRDIEAMYKMNGVDENELKANYKASVEKEYNKLKNNVTDIVYGKDSKKIKALQEELIAQGYDITADGVAGKETKGALGEYLSKKNNEINSKVDNFSALEYGKNIVNKSYMDYAESFANQKRDIDLIFDQGTALLTKIKAQKEETQKLINGFASIVRPDVNTEIATPAKAINVDAYVKMKEDADKALAQTKAAVDKMTVGTPLGDNPNTNSFLINAWSQSGGDPNKFRQIVRTNPDFTISGMSDNKIDELSNFLTSPAGPAISQAYQAYGTASSVSEAIKQNDASLTKTYTNTEQGSREFQKLKEQYKRPGESDADFMQSIVNKDSRFNIRSSGSPTSGEGGVVGNAAQSFLSSRNSFIKNDKSGDFPKSLNAYTIGSTNDSKAMGPLKKLIENDLQNGDNGGYTSEGTQGIIWRDSKGNDVTNKVNSYDNFNMDLGVLGGLSTGYTFTAKTKIGAKDVMIHASVDKIPVTHNDAVKSTLMAVKANAKNVKDDQLDQVTTMALAGLNGDINGTKVAAQNQIRLTKNNTTSLDIVMPILDQSGNITGVKNASERGNPNVRGMYLETIEENGQTYKKYKIYNPNSSDKEKFIYTQVIYKDGRPKMEVQMPGKNGNLFFNTSDAVDYDMLNKKYDSQLPTIQEINRVPTGTQVSAEQVGQMFGMASSRSTFLNED